MSDGQVRRRPAIALAVADRLGLSVEDRTVRLERSGNKVLQNRINWSITYLHKAGYLEIPSRGNIQISDDGRVLASKELESLNIAALKAHSPQFLEWSTASQAAAVARRRGGAHASTAKDAGVVGESDDTPEESLLAALRTIRDALESDLHEQITQCAPGFFEKLVVDVLEAMGYGGDFEGAATVTQYVKDGGIDGIIRQDKLGLDTVYVQAKRQQANVGRPALQAFVGAMQGEGVRKGVFVTTASFSTEAREYVNTIESRIVLVGGQELAGLMVDHNVGVSAAHLFEIKKIDNDYFDESE
jgi:restriction system protein